MPCAKDEQLSLRPGEGLEEQRHVPATALTGLLGKRIADALRSGHAACEETRRVLDRLELEVAAPDGPPLELAVRDDHARAGFARNAALHFRDDDQRAGSLLALQLGESLDPGGHGNELTLKYVRAACLS